MTCHATIRYISTGRPSALPPVLSKCFPSHKRGSISDIQELAGIGMVHTSNDNIVLLVRNPTLPQQDLTNPSLWGELFAC